MFHSTVMRILTQETKESEVAGCNTTEQITSFVKTFVQFFWTGPQHVWNLKVPKDYASIKHCAKEADISAEMTIHFVILDKLSKACIPKYEIKKKKSLM